MTSTPPPPSSKSWSLVRTLRNVVLNRQSVERMAARFANLDKKIFGTYKGTTGITIGEEQLEFSVADCVVDAAHILANRLKKDTVKSLTANQMLMFSMEAFSEAILKNLPDKIKHTYIDAVMQVEMQINFSSGENVIRVSSTGKNEPSETSYGEDSCLDELFLPIFAEAASEQANLPPRGKGTRSDVD